MSVGSDEVQPHRRAELLTMGVSLKGLHALFLISANDPLPCRKFAKSNKGGGGMVKLETI